MFRDYLCLPRPVHILCLGTLVNKAGSFVLVFLPIYTSEQLGFSIQFTTACVGMFGLGSIIASVIGGHLADRYGRRIVMLGSLCGGAAILLALSFVADRWAFMAAMTLFGIIHEMYRPAASAMLGDLVKPDQRPFAYGLMYIATNLGFAFGPAAGGYLAEVSWQWLFWADAATALAYAGVIAATIRETRPPTAPSSDPDKPNVDQAAVTSHISFGVAIRRILKDHDFVVFCLAGLLVAVVFMQGMSTLPLHIRQTGISPSGFGMLMSLNGLMIVLFQVPITYWLRRFPAMALTIWGDVLFTVGFCMHAFADDAVIFACAIAIWTTGEIIHAPITNTIAANLAPSELRARYMGILNLTFAVALTIGAPLGGAAFEHLGPFRLWIAAAGLVVLAIVLEATVYRSITRRLRKVAVESACGKQG